MVKENRYLQLLQIGLSGGTPAGIFCEEERGKIEAAGVR